MEKVEKNIKPLSSAVSPARNKLRRELEGIFNNVGAFFRRFGKSCGRIVIDTDRFWYTIGCSN